MSPYHDGKSFAPLPPLSPPWPSPSGPSLAFDQPTREQIALAVQWLSAYLREQRERHLPVAGPLNSQNKAILQPHFSRELLDQVRVLDLKGARVAAPDFFAEVRAAGFEPPEISHMDSLTFLDVVVFNERLTLRALFHALVHSVQIHVLGLDRYSELWVESFVKHKAHFVVALEVHAFSLTSHFLSPSPEPFSVEDHVRRWVADRRY